MVIAHKPRRRLYYLSYCPNIGYMALLLNIQRPVMVQSHKRVTINATGCGFDSHSKK